MSDAYQKTFRGYLVDHHLPAPPTATLARLSINEYRDFFRTARISNLMLYCKDHWATAITTHGWAPSPRPPGRLGGGSQAGAAGRGH